MDKENNTEAVSEENIYCLNGRVPVKKAIPFGLQHVLAMFVSNLAPVLIVCSAAFVRGSENHLSPAEITQLLQCAMFAAGIGTVCSFTRYGRLAPGFRSLWESVLPFLVVC